MNAFYDNLACRLLARRRTALINDVKYFAAGNNAAYTLPAASWGAILVAT